MAFQFSLAAVLRLRESLEKREERALEAIQLEIARTAHQITTLTAEMGGANQHRERALGQGLLGGQLQSLMGEEQAAGVRLHSLVVALQMLEQRRQEQRTVYQVVHQDRELLTGMYTKQRETYERETLRQEQKRLDDIFMARRHRIL